MLAYLIAPLSKQIGVLKVESLLECLPASSSQGTDKQAEAELTDLPRTTQSEQQLAVSASSAGNTDQLEDQLTSQVAKERLRALRKPADTYPGHMLKLQEIVTPIQYNRRP